MNLNKVFLIGRLTQDPETRSTPSGQTVTTIKMATNRVWNDPSSGRKDSTEFHTVVAWSRLGEIAGQYLKKGAMVMIEGRLQTRSWTGNDNVKRYSTEIVAENLQMGPRGAGQQGGNEYQRPAPANNNSQPADELEIPIIDENEPTQSGIDSDKPISEEDLPF